MLLPQGPDGVNPIWQSTKLHGAVFQGCHCLLPLHRLELSVYNVCASWRSKLGYDTPSRYLAIGWKHCILLLFKNIITVVIYHY